ncbi:methyltransferase-like protein 27 [Saccoglossus kowalevskii]|uniref:Uncharacterized protein LOC102803444 n=1 Tax=Saccoglossus kowalevskii TaxID=10224 RepID=A0ABM0M3W3_SACKO|nr:PREDICTED: uncharacterized protein LOC102803444 [Saccoglossus kowalevskii]
MATNENVDRAFRNMVTIRDSTKSSQEIREHYNTWSKTFEKEAALLGWNAPKYTAKCLSDLLPERNAYVLDCAAGTGLVGLELKHLGYRNIDAVDLSDDSLQKAELKGCYRQLICAKLNEHPIMTIKPDTYDGIVCCGAFIDGHLNDKCLIEWSRILKPNGIICICLNTKFISQLEGPVLDRLLKDNILEQVQKIIVSNYVQEEDGYVVSFRLLKNQPQ